MNVLTRELMLAVATGALLSLNVHANLGSDNEESTEASFQAGKEAIKAEDWNKAVDQLEKAVSAEPKNADARNFLGYAYRKLGYLEQSLMHYKEALALNPKHKQAHEYLGEAYLMMNKVADAERHLAELNRLCSPIPCEEQKMLKTAIDDFKKGVKRN